MTHPSRQAATREPLVVQVPGDKSITHRALMFASLATGESRIVRPLDAADTRSTADALRALGCTIANEDAGSTRPAGLGDVLRIRGRGLRGWKQTGLALDCGNSGTTARLMLGALAAHPFPSELIGDASLQSRPMRRVTEPLSAMGARFDELGEPGRLPLRVHGGDMRSITFDNLQSSAQVKSALLLAGLNGGVYAEVREPRLSRDHTERMLRAMGANISTRQHDNAFTAALTPTEHLDPLDITIPGDFSSAAFFIAAAMLSHERPVVLPDVGLNPGRAGMLEVLRRMSGDFTMSDARDEAGEPVATITARPSSHTATDIEAAEIPSLIDEIPIIAMMAVRAEGTTRITGARELRVKETDRIHALVENLRAIGATVEELEDGLVIHGSYRPLRGRVRAFGDHRIAMAFGVLGGVRGNHIEIDDPDVVGVSYPAFWEHLGALIGIAS